MSIGTTLSVISDDIVSQPIHAMLLWTGESCVISTIMPFSGIDLFHPDIVAPRVTDITFIVISYSQPRNLSCGTSSPRCICKSPLFSSPTARFQL
jgi:hypothetical protein